MNAKHGVRITLTLLLVLGGPAQAATGEELKDAFKKGVELKDFLKDPLGSLLSGLSGGVDKSISLVIQKALGDGLDQVFGTENPSKEANPIFTAGNTEVSKSIFGDTISAFNLAMGDSLNPARTKKFIDENNKAQEIARIARQGGIDKRVAQENSSAGKEDTNGGLALGLANNNFTEESKKQTAELYKTSINEAQAYKLADLATNKDAVEVNTANAKRMDTATTNLETETKNAVSTRATVQALNFAVSSMMKQDLFGNQRLQDRLNLMLLQGARTNDQIGDLVSHFRKEDAGKLAAYVERVNNAQAEANRSINSFKNAADNTKETLKNGSYSDTVGDAVTFGDLKVPKDSEYKAPKSSEFDGTDIITVGGEVPPGTEGAPADTGTPIPVPPPINPNIPNPNIPKAPTAGKTGENPVPSNKDELSPTKKVLDELTDKYKTPTPEAEKTPPPTPPQKEIKFKSAEYFDSEEYKVAWRAYYRAERRLVCELKDPQNKDCRYTSLGYRLTPEEDKRIKAQIDLPNPDEVDVINKLPLW